MVFVYAIIERELMRVLLFLFGVVFALNLVSILQLSGLGTYGCVISFCLFTALCVVFFIERD